MTSHVRRLRPFDGLCLTADDLLLEQRYHRDARRRLASEVWGQGIVRGLIVSWGEMPGRDLEVASGAGVSALGDLLQLAERRMLSLSEPQAEGDHLLWLVHREGPDPEASRELFDGTACASPFVVEWLDLVVLPAAEPLPEGVALAWLRARLGTWTLLRRSVVRAGVTRRRAPSRLAGVVQRLVDAWRALLDGPRVGAMDGRARLLGVVEAVDCMLVDRARSDLELAELAARVLRAARRWVQVDEAWPREAGAIEVEEALVRLLAALPQVGAPELAWIAWLEEVERFAIVVAQLVRRWAGSGPVVPS